MQCNFLKHPIISFDSYKASPNPISMFIFREKSGLQLVIETIGRGSPQKVGQSQPKQPGDPQLPCLPAGADSPPTPQDPRQDPALFTPAHQPVALLLTMSRWPSPASCAHPLQGPRVLICKMVPLASQQASHRQARHVWGWGRGPGATDTPSAASSWLLQTFCPG